MAIGVRNVRRPLAHSAAPGTTTTALYRAGPGDAYSDRRTGD